MTRKTAQPRFLLPTIAAHVVLTSVVWRDIARRTPRELRGSKALWRTLTALNSGNSLLYVLIGRRR